MLKLIEIKELKPGMFIIDVSNTWSRKLSVPKKMYVLNTDFVQRLVNTGIIEVFIDTSKTKDLSFTKIAEEKPKQNESFALKSLLKQAFSIRLEIQNVISELMNDAGSDKKINLTKARAAIKSVADFTLDNQFLLTGLVMMRRKSRYIFEHALCSSVLMVAFAQENGFDTETQQDYGIAAMLHDIGMLKAPSYVLNKRSDLTQDDIEQLQRHVAYGYITLKEIDGISDTILKMASQHHERLDGTGYPLGLKGDQISIPGQMAAIIDVYNAATSDRGYKKGIPPARAIAEILLKSKTAFNRDLVNIFIRSVGIYPFGTLVSLGSGLIGIVVQVEKDDLLHPVVRIIYNPSKGGMISPYNLALQEHKNDQHLKIKGVVDKEKLFLQDEDIDKILGVS